MNTSTHAAFHQALLYASRETGDSDAILFQIYWSIYVPISISLFWQSSCENKMVQFFASQYTFFSFPCIVNNNDLMIVRDDERECHDDVAS